MPSIVGLDWDADDDPEGNAQHIARHNVTPAEVREVLEGAPDFLPVDTEGPNPCYVAAGFTAGGRLLEVWGFTSRDHLLLVSGTPSPPWMPDRPIASATWESAVRGEGGIGVDERA